MKDFKTSNQINFAQKEFISDLHTNQINSNTYTNNFNTKISLQNSFENLEKFLAIELNIINSRIVINNYNQEKSYQENIISSKISEIIKKYKNFPLIIIKTLKELTNNNFTPRPLFNTSIPENISLTNNKKIPYSYSLNDLSPINYFSESDNNINNPFISDIFNQKLFLNQKRKITKYKVFISPGKNSDEKSESEIISQNNIENIGTKKIIFKLDKKSKNSKDLKIKKNPGRKKKNSGETGIHNKFSKDNMMRKLKNKVMESARKLINHMIKTEAGDRYKEFGEMRKIQGVFYQELNIKFNIWFYVQRLKSIFQFKMSSKYSKGDLDLNQQLISKIYSQQYQNLFPKTIKLLDMMFHQYYHEIFLGEKNWMDEFNINIEENHYEINYFINENKISKINEEEIFYLENMKKLAKKYELFFLKKNPRIYSDKKENKISQTKEIIKNISIQDYEKYKHYFMIKSVYYLPDIKQSLLNYLNKNNSKYGLNFEKIFLNEISGLNNTDINFTVSRINEEESQNKSNEEFKKKDKIDSSNIILFDVEKNNILKKIKKSEEKEEKIEEKKINFVLNKNIIKSNDININITKNEFNNEKNKKNKNLFVIFKSENEN